MKNSYRTKLTISSYIIGCLLLLLLTYVIDDFWKGTAYIFYKNIFMNVLPTIASILGVSAVWEIAGKKSFAREVLNLRNVSDNLIESGITHIYENFKEIEWKEELKNVSKLTTFITYGYTWRNQNRESLERFRDKEWIAIFPDYRNKDIVDELDRRFGYGKYSSEVDNKESVEMQINQAIQDFKKMGARIKLYNGTICSTYYLMDETVIFAPFKHGKKKQFVPAFKVCSSGKFYNFCKNDIDKILDESTDFTEA